MKPCPSNPPTCPPHPLLEPIITHNAAHHHALLTACYDDPLPLLYPFILIHPPLPHPHLPPAHPQLLNHPSEARYGALLSPYLEDPSNLFIISSDFCHWGRRFSYTFYDNSKVGLCCSNL